jgi:hypothetical protein
MGGTALLAIFLQISLTDILVKTQWTRCKPLATRLSVREILARFNLYQMEADSLEDGTLDVSLNLDQIERNDYWNL